MGVIQWVQQTHPLWNTDQKGMQQIMYNIWGKVIGQIQPRLTEKLNENPYGLGIQESTNLDNVNELKKPKRPVKMVDIFQLWLRH